MIASLIETLELPNFGHMITSTMSFESGNKILLMTSWSEVMTSQPLFQNTFLKKAQSS